jgi:hypothetical protein
MASEWPDPDPSISELVLENVERILGRSLDENCVDGVQYKT